MAKRTQKKMYNKNNNNNQLKNNKTFWQHLKLNEEKFK